MDDYSYDADSSERFLYTRPSRNSYVPRYVRSDPQPVPYRSNGFNPIPHFGYHQNNFPIHRRQPARFSPGISVSSEIPATPEPERIRIMQEELDKVVRDLHTLKMERDRKQDGNIEDEEARRAAGDAIMQHPWQKELLALSEQLQAEKERSRKLEIEKEAIQARALLEAENDIKRRTAAEIAAEQDRQKREEEIRKEAEGVALARADNEKKVQDELQQARLEQLQEMIEKLGGQVSMMEKKESERLCEEKKKEEKKRREMVEEMEREALQRMRDEKARQEQAEAERLAEEEKLKLARELEEKKRIEIEAKEVIRVQEEARIREEMKRQAQERLLQQSIDDAKRQEALRHAKDEETRKHIDEMVKQNLEQKLKLESERLYYDLRRHTIGTRPDIKIDTVQSRQVPGFLTGHQPSPLKNSVNELPASNPFSRNRSSITMSQPGHGLKSPWEAYQSVGLAREKASDEAQQCNDWVYGNQTQLQRHPGAASRTPQSRLYTNGASTASHVSPRTRNAHGCDRGLGSGINAAGWSPQNPYRQIQRQKMVPEPIPGTRPDSAAAFQQAHGPVQNLIDDLDDEDGQSDASFSDDSSDGGEIQCDRVCTPNGRATAYGGTSVHSLESPTQPIYTPTSSSGLENSGHLPDIKQQSRSSGDMSGLYANAPGNTGNGREFQPGLQEAPIFNNRRSASTIQGGVAGFPPSPNIQGLHRAQSSQQLQFNADSGMFTNVPYVMVPLIPGYPIQFSSPAQ